MLQLTIYTSRRDGTVVVLCRNDDVICMVGIVATYHDFGGQIDDDEED